MLAACQTGNITLVRRCLQYPGCDPNMLLPVRERYRAPPLVVFSSATHTPAISSTICHLLLEAKASPFARDTNACTYYHFKVRFCSFLLLCIRVVQLVKAIKSPAKFRSLVKEIESTAKEDTAITPSFSFDFNALIPAGDISNGRKLRGALHYARPLLVVVRSQEYQALGSQNAICKLLIEKKADPRAPDSNGLRAVDYLVGNCMLCFSSHI